MQHDVQHAKSSPSIKRDIYNCENRFSETENLLLNNKTKIVLRQSTDNYSENVGRYISFEDMVIITVIYKVTNECPSYSTSIGIPRPYVSDGIAVKDSTGNYTFQINQKGVFQNVSVLPPGTYSVYAVYITRNL